MRYPCCFEETQPLLPKFLRVCNEFLPVGLREAAKEVYSWLSEDAEDVALQSNREGRSGWETFRSRSAIRAQHYRLRAGHPMVRSAMAGRHAAPECADVVGASASPLPALGDDVLVHGRSFFGVASELRRPDWLWRPAVPGACPDFHSRASGNVGDCMGGPLGV